MGGSEIYHREHKMFALKCAIICLIQKKIPQVASTAASNLRDMIYLQMTRLGDE